jgi:hypothetical protein
MCVLKCSILFRFVAVARGPGEMRAKTWERADTGGKKTHTLHGNGVGAIRPSGRITGDVCATARNPEVRIMRRNCQMRLAANTGQFVFWYQHSLAGAVL